MKKLLSTIAILTCIIINANAQKVEILGDAMVTGQLEVMDTILFSDGSQLASACLQFLQDADQDTKITVEHQPDSDEIHLISDGETVMIIDRARLRIIHKGNSMFIGHQAGSKDDGNNSNLFIGSFAGANNISGSNNIYLGNNAGRSNQVGTDNVYIGRDAGSEEGGANNTFLGAYSGFNNLGNQNTMIGHQSGESLSGSRNTILGASAGANASGDGNIIIGSDAGKSAVGDNQLIIHNTDSSTPLISGRFDNETIVFNADATVKKNLILEEDINLLQLSTSGTNGINFGFDGTARFGLTASQYIIPFLNPPLEVNRIHLGPNAGGVVDRKFTMDMLGRVGIGTETPSTSLHVSGNSTFGHIMKIENTAPGLEGDGLEIKLNRPTNGAGNNFVTFSDQNGIAGRIEGFSVTEDIAMATFPDIDITDYFDLVSIENFVFNPGTPLTFAGGQLPSLSGGEWPTFNPGQLPSLNPGQLPSFDFGDPGMITLDATFDIGNFIASVACALNPGCFDYPDFYTFNPGVTGYESPSLNPGQLPFLTGGQPPSLSVGSFPDFDPGFAPTLIDGQLPSFDIDFLFNPSPLAGAFVDLKSVMCWALENGERSLMTVNPQDISMMQQSAYLSNLADCKNGGVTYGSGGADYAEYLMRDSLAEYMESGQIVGVQGGKISKNTEGAEQLLVISMMPIVLGNMPEDTASIANYEKVAFLGQAPVWIVGMVKSGDYIIPSGRNDGYGMAVAPNDLKLEHISKIVGKAWSDGDNAINMVNMAIGLKTNEMAQILENQADKMDVFESRLAKLEAVVGEVKYK